MEQLIEIALVLALLWRLVLGAALGALLAFAISLVFPGLASGAWFALLFIGASAGLVWHAGVVSAREAASGHTVQPISTPVSFLGIALVGGLWGWLLVSAARFIVAVLSLLSMPFVLGPLFGRLAKQRVGVKEISFAIVASLTGFFVPYGINFVFGVPGA